MMESTGDLRDFHGLFETDRDCYSYLYEMK